MDRLFTLCAAAALALSLSGCNQTASVGNHDADLKAIQDTETQWNADYVAKDTAKLAAHYTDDAALMAPGMDPARGKDAINKEMAGMVADPALSLAFHADRVDVSSAGDIGYTQGSYTYAYTDPQSKKVMNDHGSYVTVYKKQADGSWKAVSDIATSSVPMMPPAPAGKGAKKAM